MILLPENMRVALLVNHARHIAAQLEGFPDPDPVPLLKLFNPCGSARWLVTELDEDGDTMFGLADLGFGTPELGSFSLSEITAVRLPFRLTIERDVHFRSHHPMSIWVDLANSLGSIEQAEIAVMHIGSDPWPRED